MSEPSQRTIIRSMKKSVEHAYRELVSYAVSVQDIDDQNKIVHEQFMKTVRELERLKLILGQRKLELYC